MDTPGVPLRWSAHEHEHVERDASWYLALTILTACLAVIGVLLGDSLFSVLIVLAAITLALLSRTPPPLTDFTLSERGLRINNTMHRFEDMIAFWVEDHDADPPVLLIDTTLWSAPNIVIPLKGVDPQAVRQFLDSHLDEKPMKEPLAHKILEQLGL